MRFWTDAISWTTRHEEIKTSDEGYEITVGEIREVDGEFITDLYPNGQFGSNEMSDYERHDNFDDALASAIFALEELQEVY